MPPLTPLDPTLKARISGVLKENLGSYPPRLQMVAKYIVDHPADFGLDSIRVTARKAGVSTFTLVRMADALGIGGFEELRAPFRRALLSGAAEDGRPEWLFRISAESRCGAVQAEAAANTLAIVERSLRCQEPARMERVADLLLSARNVYLTATRASYSLAYFLNYVGRMAVPSIQLIPRYMNSPIDEMSDAGADDLLLAITFTPYSRETIEACRFARKRGTRLILISDSDIVVPELKPDESLIASTLSTHHFGCFSGAMALVENLIAILIERGGAGARSRIEAYETLRDEIDAYWPAPKKQ